MLKKTIKIIFKTISTVALIVVTTFITAAIVVRKYIDIWR